MDVEILEAVRTVAQRFADEEVSPLVGTEGRDGDLRRLPEVFARAAEVGLLGSHDSDSDDEPGLGIWALSAPDAPDATADLGVNVAAMSVAILGAIAEVCAGVAARMHYAGLGMLELNDCDHGFSNVAACVPQCDWRAGALALETPLTEAPSLRDEGLSGSCEFVASAGRQPACVVYAWASASASTRKGWQRVLVPYDAPGCRMEPLGRRTGLGALDVCRVQFTKVPVSACRSLPVRSPRDAVRPLLLGLSAVAIGNARGALSAARQYATERRQGGKFIAEHDAVRLLLGSSAARLAGATAHLSSACRSAGSADASLASAAAAKLRVSVESEQVVTDCLQVFGGVGYMEDYRMEKRLRDAMTLTSMGISPSALSFLCESGNP